MITTFPGWTEVDCENYKMLPLLLQPIVENAMLHGLEEKESGGLIRIQIDTDEEKDHLLVSVADNGCGMDQDQVRKLLETINSGQDGSTSRIGLQNVQKRLKMYCGEEFGLKIESEVGSGNKGYDYFAAAGEGAKT